MNCKACGHTDEGRYPDGWPQDRIDRDKFIEVKIVERGPFFVGLPDNWPVGQSGSSSVVRGTPVLVFACPACGALKIEVKP